MRERDVEAELAGLTLGQADMVLDTARRLLWAAQFIGKELPLPPSVPTEFPAAVIARLLEGLTLEEVAEHLERTRMKIWLDAFPNATPQVFNIAAVGGSAH